MSVYELQALAADGSVSGILARHAGIEASLEFSDVGAVRIQYPQLALGYNLLTHRREVRLLKDGVELPNGRWLITEDERNEVSEEQTGSISTWTGSSLLDILHGGLVWPGDINVFDNATAGTLIRTYLLRAQTRGAVLGITFATFSNTLDSNGVAWTKQLDIEYRPGVNILQILQNLVDQGMCEAQMVGRDLRLYNPGTLSTDRTLANPPIILRKGRDISEAPRRGSSRDLATVALIEGDDSKFQTVVDATAQAQWGRIETYISQGGVSDTGTLNALAQANLDLIKQPRLEKTHGLTLASTGPQPLTDYFVGDYVFSDVGNGNERYRVRQYVLTIGQDGAVGGAIVLNDKMAEAEEALVRRVNGILGGATATGVTPAVPGIDRLAPATPSSPSVTSATYTTPSGAVEAQVSISWLQVTTNTDSTAIDDLAGYEVQYRVNAGNWAPAGFRDTTTAYLSGFSPGAVIDVQVRAIDTSGNRSAWSVSGTVTAAADTTAPPTPSAPVLDANAFLGALRVTWNGLGSVGEAMPADFRRLEVHASTVNGFTPTSATLRDDLPSIGGVLTLPLSVGVPWYVKFVAVDNVGNRSAASAQTTGTPRSAITGDIGNNTIKSANIDVLAVNDGNIASCSIGKLITGTLAADLVVGARIKTANTGLRAEMNSAGFFHYNAAGIEDFGADSSGVRVRGTLMASNYYSRDAHPRIEIGPDVQYDGRDVIRFTRPDGTVAAYILMEDESLTSGIADQIILGVPPDEDRNGAMVTIMSASDASGKSIIALESFGGKIAVGGLLDNTNSNALRTSPGLTGKVIRKGRTQVTTDANGIATVAHSFGATPTTVDPTGSSPNAGASAIGSLLTYNYTSSNFTIRAWNVTGGILANTAITFNWEAAN